MKKVEGKSGNSKGKRKRREKKSRGLKFEKILAPHIYFNLIVPQLIHIH